MSLTLGRLARDVEVHERTLRRAAGRGLIHARRTSPRRLSLSDSETVWVRSHWPLVQKLLAVLRTEPNIELAVLFGSTARGDDVAGISDLDLLVGLRRPSPGALEALRLRLGARLPAEVQVVPADAVLDNPRLMAEVLRDGRPLVDRERAWPLLQAQARQAQVLADRSGDESREGARAALGYFQELAAARAQSPVGTV
jgi:predicted nucleotidyltransferase